MLDSRIQPNTVRRFMTVLGVDELEVSRICDGLLVELPLSDTLDEIVAAASDDIADEYEALERLSFCESATVLLRRRDIIASFAGTKDAFADDHGRVIELAAQAEQLLELAGLSLEQWEVRDA